MFDELNSAKDFFNHSELHLNLFLLNLIKSILFLALTPGLLVPNEGFIWEKLFSKSRICNCNHNSKRDIHASAEDDFFRNIRLVNTSFTEKTNRPNCHSHPESPVHECACKKEKSDPFFSQIRLISHYVIASKISLSPVIEYSFPMKGIDFAKLTLAHGKRLKRPPKSIYISLFQFRFRKFASNVRSNF